jgi:hypothetical protein
LQITLYHEKVMSNQKKGENNRATCSNDNPDTQTTTHRSRLRSAVHDGSPRSAVNIGKCLRVVRFSLLPILQIVAKQFFQVMKTRLQIKYQQER